MDNSIQDNIGKILEKFPLPSKCERPLKLGVIGCGKMFQNCHGEAIKILQTFGWPISVGTVIDTNEDALEQAIKDFPNAFAYNDYQKVCDLNSYDAFVVQLWDPHSEQAAEWLLNMGIPFLIEKPVSLNIDILQRLCALSTENIPVAVGYNRRFQCAAEDFREIYQSMSGATHFKCRFLRSCRSEPLFYEDVMGHSLDFIKSVVGDYQIDNVRCSGESLSSGIKSYIVVDASFKCGTIEFEFRPSCGQNLESYEIISCKKSAKLVYHPIEQIAEPPQMICYTPSGKKNYIPEDITGYSNSHRMMVLQGFLHQMANAINYISGSNADNICNLDDTCNVLIKIKKIMELARKS